MRTAQARALRILDTDRGPITLDPLPEDTDRAAVELAARTAARNILARHEIRVWLEANEHSQHADALADLVPSSAAAALADPQAEDQDEPDGLDDLHQLLTLAAAVT